MALSDQTKVSSLVSRARTIILRPLFPSSAAQYANSFYGFAREAGLFYFWVSSELDLYKLRNDGGADRAVVEQH